MPITFNRTLKLLPSSPGLKQCPVQTRLRLRRCLHFSAVLAASLTTVLFSLSVVSGHRAAKLLGGLEANFWRVTLAALFLGLWAYTFGSGLAGVALPVFLLSGLSGIGLGDIAYYQALPRLGPRHTVLMVQCLTPPCGALIEYLWMGTRLTLPQIGCALLVLTGVVIALAPGDHLKHSRRELLLGLGCCALAALGGAGGAVLSRKAYAVVHAHGEHIDAISAGFQRIAGGAILGGICLLIAKRHQFLRPAAGASQWDLSASQKKWRAVWLWVLLNSLAGQTLGVSCMQWALETTPTGIVLAIIATTPVVVIPFTMLFERERPTLHSVLGGSVAVCGVIGLALAR